MDDHFIDGQNELTLTGVQHIFPVQPTAAECYLSTPSHFTIMQCGDVR